MLPHHWWADSWAVTTKAASPFFSFLVRKPIPSEKVMSVGNPWAYWASAGNSLSFSSCQG